MLKSMTAFGRASMTSPRGRFAVEIQSVNRKHLEVNTYLPRELVRFDPDIKNWVAARVARGNLNIKVVVAFEAESPIVVTPNVPLAFQIKDAWDQIAHALKLPESDRFRLSMLVKEPGVLLYDEEMKDETAWRDDLKQTIEKALDQLVQMKSREGGVLQKDISQRLSLLRQSIDSIATKAPGATDRFRQKLLERLQEVLPGSVENEERLLREVCVYAEKVDISEEITRFNSHLAQIADLLAGDKEGVGKTLEFMLQELNREANTIGAKTSDVDVTKSVIAIKSELEKIREQIQNVE